MFENCYKYVLFKSHLICTGTAEDQLKPAYEKGCKHEYEYAAIVIVAQIRLVTNPRAVFYCLIQRRTMETMKLIYIQYFEPITEQY